MEKVSFNKGDSGNWAVDYRPSNIANPDIVKPAPKTENSKIAVRTETAKPNTESTGEKELMSDTEHKKREAQLIQKLEDERLAQQKLLRTFYAEKARVDMSPDQVRDTMKALAERSIEQQMVRDGTSMKVEWKSELHQIRVEISEDAYDKLRAHTDSEQDFAEALQA